MMEEDDLMGDLIPIEENCGFGFSEDKDKDDDDSVSKRRRTEYDRDLKIIFNGGGGDLPKEQIEEEEEEIDEEQQRWLLRTKWELTTTCQEPHRSKLLNFFLKEEDRDPRFNKIVNNPDGYYCIDVLRHHGGQDLPSILSSPTRDYLVRSNNIHLKVPVTCLTGKKVGLYFAVFKRPQCQNFARILADAYDELMERGDFEIVVIPASFDKSFNGIISKMPWLAVPYSDTEALSHLHMLFVAFSRPLFVIVDENGEVLTYDGTKVIRDYGPEGYPFTPERLKENEELVEAAKQNQSLQSIFSKSLGFVLSPDGKKVSISELEGKTVGLYFRGRDTYCTSKLLEIYEDLTCMGEEFEIVMILLEDDKEFFKLTSQSHPWLSLPFEDKSRWRLHSYFEVSDLPTLVLIGPDGKTIQSDVLDAVEKYGIDAYPFTAEAFSELKRIDKVCQEAQTLESLFVSGDLDFVIRIDGTKVPVSSLAGKHVFLYFSSSSCRYLTDELEIFEKSEDYAFEVISIFDEVYKSSFDKCFSKMSSCLALPFCDWRKYHLCKIFKDAPLLVSFGPTGKFITTETLKLIELYGAEAYPFTADRIEELGKRYDEVAKGMPDKVYAHLLHYHDLFRSPSPQYKCRCCGKMGNVCSFKCKRCRSVYRPECALEYQDV